MVKNSMTMYVRMVVVILISLYTLPIILRALGAEDYGIYQVVGGFVSLFAFVQASLASGCERFYAFAIGRGERKELKSVFVTSRTIFFVLALFAFLIVEIVGAWFLNCKMVIPNDRMYAANCVFHFSAVTFALGLFMTPYHSSMIAHEHISTYAYVSIFEVLARLAVVFLLVAYPDDKLIFFALSIFIISFLSQVFYLIYAYKHFEETRTLSLKYKPGLIIDLAAYAGWNIIGAFSNILRTHGLNVVMNLFFGPLLNAAHSLSSTISGLMNQLISNVYMVTRPQMVKQFAMGNEEEMWGIVFKSSKFTIFLLSLVIVPLIIEMDFVLKLWLGEYPQYTNDIAIFMIIGILIECMSNQIIGAFQAKNKIKYCQIIPNIVTLSVIPISYLFLSIYNKPTLPYIISVFISVIYSISVLLLAYKYINFDFSKYVVNVIIRSITPLLFTLLLTKMVIGHFDPSFLRLIITVLISAFLNIICMWYFGLDKLEHNIIKNFITQRIK